MLTIQSSTTSSKLNTVLFTCQKLRLKHSRFKLTMWRKWNKRLLMAYVQRLDISFLQYRITKSVSCNGQRPVGVPHTCLCRNGFSFKNWNLISCLSSSVITTQPLAQYDKLMRPIYSLTQNANNTFECMYYVWFLLLLFC